MSPARQRTTHLETPRAVLLAAAASLVTLVTASCGSPKPAPPKAAVQPVQPAPATPAATLTPEEAMAEAKSLFATRCSPCHGAEGRGDGAASAGLTPPPRDFHDPAWQASVTDDHVEKIVMYGGVAVGKAPTMPANPDLVAKTEVVKALRMHVRSLGDKPAAP